MVEFRVQPGIVNFVMSLIMERISVWCMDMNLSSAVLNIYYRRIDKGRKILVKSADIPGLTHCLLGNRCELVHVTASVLKAALLSLILVMGVLMTSRTELVLSETLKMSTFKLAPSDEAWLRPVVYTVQRLSYHSAKCSVEESGKTTYYTLAFNLENGVQLENDLGDPEVNSTSQYLIDYSTIICMIPGRVMNPRRLATVVGCSREAPGDCLKQTIVRKRNNITVIANGAEGYEHGLYNFTDYDPEGVATTWPEHTNPRLTCLTSEALDMNRNTRVSQSCLLVSGNGTHTIVELWGVYLDDHDDVFFASRYPGPVFEGDLAIERYQSADLLADIRISDIVVFKYFSEKVVARSSEFVGSTPVQMAQPKTITELPLSVVVLGGAAALFLCITRIVFCFTIDRDKRPRINTINGLSSVLRETNSPSGDCWLKGEEARVGLSPSSDDKPEFGVVDIKEYEAVPNQGSREGSSLGNI